MFEDIWNQIIENEGETFTQIRGQTFTYEIVGNAIKPSTTNQFITKGTFQKAVDLLPVQNTSSLQHLRGPSYLFAILTDDRILKIET